MPIAHGERVSFEAQKVFLAVEKEHPMDLVFARSDRALSAQRVKNR